MTSQPGLKGTYVRPIEPTLFPRPPTAGTVDETDDGDAQLASHLLGVHLLLEDGGVSRAAADGEVVAANHDRPAVDAAAAHYEVGGDDALQLGPLVLRLAGQLADLVEAAGVEEGCDPFANGEPAGVVLALDLLSAAHGPRQPLAPPQLLELWLPGHPAITSR